MTIAVQSVDDRDIALATRLAEQSKWAEAQTVCHRVLNRTPDHPVAYHLLGVIAFQIDRPEIAVNLFSRSLALRPDPDVYRNLGTALDGLGRHRDAIEVYRQALLRNPLSAEAHNAMGFAYAQLGEADPAVACFERALELKPAFRVAIENLLVFLDTSDRIERCEAGLAEKSLPPEDRYMLLIHCANAQWAIGSYDDLRRSLYRAHKVRPADSTSGRVAVMRVFDLFLRRLIKFRRTNPKEFRTDARKTIYAIGDSHTLSYANTMLPLGETSYKVVARCLLPDYAWRFAEGKPNGTVAAFQHAVKDLPEKALVLCSFGESDCSIGTGIMKFLKRTGGEVEKVVAEEVRRYVNGVVKLVKQRRLQVFFLGIPASRPDAPSANAPTVTEQERELRRKIVAAFNDHLRRATTDVGHAYVDVFGMTANAGGFADGRMHLDPIHLRPDALRKAPIYLLGTRM